MSTSTRKSSLIGFVIGATLLVLAARSFPLKIAAAAPQAQAASNLAATMLTGKIQTGDGKPLEGVTVSARNLDRTFTTTVFTDEKGNYFFPELEKGKYHMWAQAVGFETERTELSLDPAKDTRMNFALKTHDDVMTQLSSAEMVDALPGGTFEDRRMKEIFQHNCGNCHVPGFALQNRFDKAGWLKILTAMETANAGVGGWGEKPRPSIQHFREELATYLTKMRGPDPSPMKPHPLPRPTGDAARVVMTEYDIPPAETPNRLAVLDGSDWSDGNPSDFRNRGTHDVTEDFDGNAWVTSTSPNHVRTFAKIDTKTGKITNYKVDFRGDWVRWSHAIITAPDGKLWITLNGSAGTVGFKDKLNGTLGRIDPRTGQIELFNSPEGMTPVTPFGGFVSIDGKGKVWTVTLKGALRFDPETKKFIGDFISPSAYNPDFATYGVASDSAGNGWWAIITEDKLGTSDIKTGESREEQLAPRMEMAEFTTEEDRKFYEHAPPNGETATPWAQTPRRMTGDQTGPTVWANDLFGQDIAGIDIRTSKVKYVDLPVPYGTAYALHIDKKHQVWATLRNADRVGKYDPETNKWTVYQLPSRGLECRGVNADEYGKTGNVWVASWRASKAIRLQFRTEQQMQAAQAKLPAAKEAIAASSGSSSQTLSIGTGTSMSGTPLKGEKLFLQRCSLCHWGVPPLFKTYAPLLHKDVVAAMGDDAMRKIILEGSPRMPAWKYVLKPSDIDEILAYLKTVPQEEVTHQSAADAGN